LLAGKSNFQRRSLQEVRLLSDRVETGIGRDYGKDRRQAERRGDESHGGYHKVSCPRETRHKSTHGLFMITAITQHRKAVVAWGMQGCVLVAIGLGQPASMAEATEALADLRAANALIKKRLEMVTPIR